MGGTLGMGYQPSLLAKFTKVRPGERDAALVMFPSVTPDGRPGLTVIQVGEGFIGLLLPMCPAGNVWRYDPPAWLHESASVSAGGSQQVR